MRATIGPTDGVVIKLDDLKLREQAGSTSKFPRWAVAFKIAASEAFLASTIREVQSIGGIEDVQFEEGPRTREAAAAFRAHVEAELARAG